MITSAWASIPRCLRRCMRRSIAAVPVRAGHAISQAPITITCCWSANWPICKPPASQALRGHAGSNQFCRMLFCLCGQHGAQSRAAAASGRKPAGRVGRPGQIDAGSLVTRIGTDRVDAGDRCDPACQPVGDLPAGRELSGCRCPSPRGNFAPESAEQASQEACPKSPGARANCGGTG
jgi:hypothetical protein